MAVGYIDIKSDMQTVSVALAQCEIEIELSTAEGNKAIRVLHGYGSHGTGGEIKKALKTRLSFLKRHKVIVDFVSGEQWMIGHPMRDKAVRHCADLMADSMMGMGNSGWTIILL